MLIDEMRNIHATCQFASVLALPWPLRYLTRIASEQCLRHIMITTILVCLIYTEQWLLLLSSSTSAADLKQPYSERTSVNSAKDVLIVLFHRWTE